MLSGKSTFAMKLLSGESIIPCRIQGFCVEKDYSSATKGIESRPA